MYRLLGYFCIVGLLRVQCLLGNYWLALKMLDPIDLSKKGLYSRVTSCQITLYYYMGFSYLMLRRYIDAIKTFTAILLYISRTKQYHTRSYQYEMVRILPMPHLNRNSLVSPPDHQEERADVCTAGDRSLSVPSADR